MDKIEFNGVSYPILQSQGFAAQFAFPFAKHFCKGFGVDVGCMKKEWSYPESIPVDISFEDGLHALNLPPNLDYIFSSHCLEHLDNYVDAIEYWYSQLKSGGILFLYLPNMDYQSYWRPWNNRKHIHYLTPEIMQSLFSDVSFKEWSNLLISGTDINCSFYVIAEKP